MNLVRLMTLITVVNIITIGAVVYAVKPDSAASFSIQQVEIQKPDPTQPEFIEGTPQKLVVPTKNVNIDILDGVYEPSTKEWTLGNSTAHHALITPKPNNQSGNTFIYGHNKGDVFGPLLNLQPGAEAFIETAEGITFRYVLRDVKDVEPSDVSLFEYNGPAILTVQTCSGAWYEQRRLFTFELMEVNQ